MFEHIYGLFNFWNRVKTWKFRAFWKILILAEYLFKIVFLPFHQEHWELSQLVSTEDRRQTLDRLGCNSESQALLWQRTLSKCTVLHPHRSDFSSSPSRQRLIHWGRILKNRIYTWWNYGEIFMAFHFNSYECM